MSIAFTSDVGVELGRGGELRDRLIVGRPHRALDRGLAGCGGHVDGDALDRGTRIEVAVVVGDCLLGRHHHPLHQLDGDREPILVEALRHGHELGVVDPGRD